MEVCWIKPFLSGWDQITILWTRTARTGPGLYKIQLWLWTGHTKVWSFSFPKAKRNYKISWKLRFLYLCQWPINRFTFCRLFHLLLSEITTSSFKSHISVTSRAQKMLKVGSWKLEVPTWYIFVTFLHSSCLLFQTGKLQQCCQSPPPPTVGQQVCITSHG